MKYIIDPVKDHTIRGDIDNFEQYPHPDGRDLTCFEPDYLFRELDLNIDSIEVLELKNSTDIGLGIKLELVTYNIESGEQISFECERPDLKDTATMPVQEIRRYAERTNLMRRQ